MRFRTRQAFTMIELIFVIVVLGILASVAIPKLAATRDDATVTKARTDVAAIRSSIKTSRAQRVLSGTPGYQPSLISTSATTADQSNTKKSGEDLFVGILDYPIKAKDKAGGWQKVASPTAGIERYRFRITNSKSVDFDYNNTSGNFDCDHTINDCKQLTE